MFRNFSGWRLVSYLPQFMRSKAAMILGSNLALVSFNFVTDDTH